MGWPDAVGGSDAAGARPDVGEHDRGIATIWAAGAMAVILAVMVFGVHLGAAASSRHRAEAAADLAALATASHAGDAEPAACAYAARVADGMAARLVSCRLAGWEATVEMEVAPPLSLGGWGVARGRARAGPVPGDQ
ncbi:MAG TPA: Rv3654c family TadE-like protein [Pseudonocardia sp.]|nr:Rv3654c family TadE-like protein [Pseudonocardia sp.]